MADLVDDYLKRLERRNFSPATIKAYRQDLEAAEAFVGKPLVKASEQELDDYIASLQGKSAATIRRRQSSLRGFFDHCRRRKAIRLKPTDNFEPPKMAERVPIHLTAGQVTRLLAALEGNLMAQVRDAAVVKCLYYTGMRAGELVGLTLASVDLDDRQLRVMGKGKKERLIPLPEEAVRALARWLEVRPPVGDALFVMARYPHAPLEYQGVRAIVAAAMERAGLGGRKLTPHKLRHTFATRLLHRKMPIDKIQRLLGHKRIETTTIYAHTELGDEARDAMDQAL